MARNINIFSPGAHRTAWIEDFLQDIRYGLRTLAKDRSFTLVTVLTLALGIGACTAVFSLVNAVLIRSLPYGEPEKLVYFFTPNPDLDVPPDVFGPANADFFDFQRDNHSFAEMTFFQQGTYNAGGNDRLEVVGAARVDEHFFTTLKSAPELGRVFDASDEQPGSDRVVVISHALWQDMFGGKADTVGSTLRLDGRPYEIVGVMPKDFGYPHKSELAGGLGNIATTQVWVPSAMTPQERAIRDGAAGVAVARLSQGVTQREAQAEASTIMSRLELLHASYQTPAGRRRMPRRALIKPFLDSAVGPVRPLMWLMLGSVGFVLLIACGNAANLLLARAANRTHEMGVRTTMGARPGRLLRQMLTESLLLSMMAGCLGVGFAYFLLNVLLRLNPGDVPRMETATLDTHVMLFLIAITVMTSVLFGFAPSLTATRASLAEFLKAGGTRGIVADGGRTRNRLAVAQIALVVVLLTGAGLLLRSYSNVLAIPTGFSASTVTLRIQLSPQYDTPLKRLAFLQELLMGLKSLPGIQTAGAIDFLPLSHAEGISAFAVEGYPNERDQLVELRSVTPDYLAAMQIPVVRGRGFTDGDGPGRVSVVLINEAFAKKYFGNQDAIGHHVRTAQMDGWGTVVGVIGNVRNMSLEDAPPPQIYLPYGIVPWLSQIGWGAHLAVRSVLSQNTVASEVRTAMQHIDSSMAIGDVHTMSDLVTEASARRRFQASLLTAFSGIALFLAVVV